MSEAETDRSAKPFARSANVTFLLMIALLPWMKHGILIDNLPAFPVDLMFLVTFALWAMALARRELRLRLHPLFLLLAAYFAAMAFSLLGSHDLTKSAFKLLTQVYLLMLPVMAFNLVTDEAKLRSAFRWWIVPAMAVGAYGAVTLILFPFFGWNSFLAEPLHHFGTLPVGPYPRIELTFEYPSMLANYLGVSLMLLLLAGAKGWTGGREVQIGGGLLLLSALFALTPGFAGLLAMLCLWTAYCRPGLRRSALVAAIALTIAEVLVSAVTPILHPTAPFLIHVPGLSAPWAPSNRLMEWIASVSNFLRTPVFGHGIGIEAVHVLFKHPEDTVAGIETDAHDVFLSIAVQCGVLGLTALTAIIAAVIREARSARHDPMVVGLAIAWLGSFVIQGLVGSFEDARHLWVLLGLILAAAYRDRERSGG